MTAEQIRSAMEAAIGYLTEHPGEGRYTDSVATAVVTDGLRCRVEGPGGEVLETDMPAAIGGAGVHPSPGWILRAAIASCAASLVAMRAAQEEIPIGRVEVAVDSESDDRGILGMADEVPAGALTTRLRFRLSGGTDADPERLRELAAWAVAHCPATETLGRVIPVETEVELA